MIHAMNQTGNVPRAGHGIRAAVLCLCLCILLQMLGVPGTLLDPASSFDLFGTSILEGPSIPPAAVQPPPAAAFEAVPETSSSLHLPVFAFTLFHPPFR